MGAANILDLKVELEGQDLTGRLFEQVRDITARVRPRLVSLSITDKRAGEADQLDLVLDDSDGKMALPREGARLRVWLGWKQGKDVTPGLVDKGSFIVDEVSHEGAPDRITIRARSADVAGSLRTRRERSWHDSTIGAIVADIARRNRLRPQCAASLSGIRVEFQAQSRESDMALLRRLGREHDAVATVKDGKLIFAPIGAGTTAGGRPIPAGTIHRRAGDRHSYQLRKREEAKGVTAAWHDRDGARQRTVTVGEQSGARRLSRVYGSEAEARRAAGAARSRAARGERKLSFDLALGRADLYPERTVRVSGFKPEIDAVSWLIVEVSHKVDGQGFTTSLQMEGV